MCHKLRVCSLASEENPALFDAQRGCCAMLAPPENAVRRGKKRDLAVNHCHGTGQVRALLCTSRHQDIGCCREDPELLTKAIGGVEGAGHEKAPGGILPRARGAFG
ncbi:endonuclease domain-containing protein [Microvirga ossetica]|uniref:endonuclease domain-containing protein n=1 Tax=Microvirga ossetica TaxID=1882682 RepID=UPI000C1500A8